MALVKTVQKKLKNVENRLDNQSGHGNGGGSNENENGGGMVNKKTHNIQNIVQCPARDLLLLLFFRSDNIEIDNILWTIF